MFTFTIYILNNYNYSFSPEMLAVGANDVYARVYDRRMLSLKQVTFFFTFLQYFKSNPSPNSFLSGQIPSTDNRRTWITIPTSVLRPVRWIPAEQHQRYHSDEWRQLLYTWTICQTQRHPNGNVQNDHTSGVQSEWQRVVGEHGSRTDLFVWFKQCKSTGGK